MAQVDAETHRAAGAVPVEVKWMGLSLSPAARAMSRTAAKTSERMESCSRPALSPVLPSRSFARSGKWPIGRRSGTVTVSARPGKDTSSTSKRTKVASWSSVRFGFDRPKNNDLAAAATSAGSTYPVQDMSAPVNPGRAAPERSRTTLATIIRLVAQATTFPAAMSSRIKPRSDSCGSLRSPTAAAAARSTVNRSPAVRRALAHRGSAGRADCPCRPGRLMLS